MAFFDAILELEVASKNTDFSNWSWNKFAKVLTNIAILDNHQDTTIGIELMERCTTNELFIQNLTCELDKKISSKNFDLGEHEGALMGLKLFLLRTDKKNRSGLPSTFTNYESCKNRSLLKATWVPITAFPGGPRTLKLSANQRYGKMMTILFYTDQNR